MTRQLEILDELAAEGKDVFEARDVQQLAGLSPQATSNALARLMRHGLVDRVARGRYAMRPLGALGTRAASEDVALAVGAVFGGRAHRIAYRSALDYHGLLRHPSREIIVATDTRTSMRRISGRPLRVVLEPAGRVMVGADPSGHGSYVSSVERALLECAARPGLARGILEVATALTAANPDARKLRELARALRLPSGLQRLGSLADALELGTLARELEPVGALRPVRLDPEHGDEGDGGAWRDDKWRVDWPFSIEELEETVRR